MLISFEDIHRQLAIYRIEITGALHIGAHECEEMPFYNRTGITQDDVIWIDALPSKVVQAKARGISNIYNAVVTEKDDDDVIFNVANNGQSSSVLEFGTHSKEHPSVVYIDTLRQKSITIDTFFKRNGLSAAKCNFWNFDIQGAELMALHGATDSIRYADALYLEVNEKELYKGCGLIGDIDAFVAKYGFKRVLTSMTSFGWGDALYVKDV